MSATPWQDRTAWLAGLVDGRDVVEDEGSGTGAVATCSALA
jgi:hypothetical protein